MESASSDVNTARRLFVGSLPRMDWRDRMRDHLKAKELSQDAVGARLGVTGGTVGHWLKGRREINLSDFMKLCRASGADPQLILFGVPHNSSVIQQLKRMLATDALAETAPDLAPLPQPRKARRKLKQ